MRLLSRLKYLLTQDLIFERQHDVHCLHPSISPRFWEKSHKRDKLVCLVFGGIVAAKPGGSGWPEYPEGFAIPHKNALPPPRGVTRFDANEAGLLHISVLTNPTMAGVMASFAGIGDVIIAEPKALIGFTGPRVIEQTIRQKLPEGFQKSEFLLAHGLIDMIVERKDLKKVVDQIISYAGCQSAAL